MRSRAWGLGLFVGLSGLLSPSVWAITTVDVPAGRVDNSYYERLEAYGCLKPELRVFGPLAYGDVQQSVVPPSAEDDEEGNPLNCKGPEWLLFERDVVTRPMRAFDGKASLVAIPSDSVPLLGLDASVLPLVPLREGRPTRDGQNLFLEATVNAQAGRTIRFAAAATPGWVGALDTSKSAFGKFYLQEGYLKLGYRRAELTYGRVGLRFGQTAHGSLLLSGATSPFNLLKFDIRPHRLGFLGSFSLQTFVTTATPSVLVNNAHFWGLGIGARPADWMELALLEMFQFGGDGVPSLSLSDTLKTAFYSGSDDLMLKRSRNMALHLGFWFPEHTAKLYSQFMFEKLSEPSQWFSNEVSVLAGVWFPKLGMGEARLEYVHTVPTAYRSTVFSQGLSYLSTPIGHPLGPDAEGLYLDGGVPFGRLRGTLRGFYEVRGKSLASTLGGAPEKRYGTGLDMTYRWIKTELSGSITYAYALNHLYVKNQNDSLAGFGLSLTYSFL